MSQREKILNTLSDTEWHCTSEFYAMYMADPRTLFSKLKKENRVMSRWCQKHKHDGMMKEWKLVTMETNPFLAKTIKDFHDQFPSVDRTVKEVDKQNALF